MTGEPVQLWASEEAVERWRRGAAVRQQSVGPATELMLDAAGLQPGYRVLDLAAGTGETSILAARRVGADGSVLAVDISAQMLEAAAAAARDEGLSNIETLITDVSYLDVPTNSFDAAISRFGLMFLGDIAEGLRRIRGALKPGARLAALVWSAQERNPYMSIPIAVAEEMGRDTSPGAPMRRVFTLSTPELLTGALEQAGFSKARAEPVATPRAFDSLDSALEFMRENSQVLRELVQELDEARQRQMWTALRERVHSYVGADGRCVLPGEALLGVGQA